MAIDLLITSTVENYTKDFKPSNILNYAEVTNFTKENEKITGV